MTEDQRNGPVSPLAWLQHSEIFGACKPPNETYHEQVNGIHFLRWRTEYFANAKEDTATYLGPNRGPQSVSRVQLGPGELFALFA